MYSYSPTQVISMIKMMWHILIIPEALEFISGSCDISAPYEDDSVINVSKGREIKHFRLT